MIALSVIMSIYNNENYLQDSIESILNQSFSDFEFLITDDCSSDNSLKIIEEYAKKDNRIKILKNKKNLGLTKSLNNMLAIVKGNYIARMDGDDIALQNRFEEQFNFLNKNNDIFICGTFVHTFGRKSKLWKYPLLNDEINVRLLFKSSIAHPTFMFRRELIDKNYRYNEKAIACEDYDFLVQISEKYKMANLSKPLLKYRLTNTSVSALARKKAEERDIAHKIIYKNKLSQIGIIPTEEELDIHRKICTGKFEKGFIFLDEVEIWLNKIRQKNKVLNKKELDKILNIYWFKTCRKFSSFGLVAFKKFINFSLFNWYNIPLKGITEFFIRSVIKYNTK